LREQQLVSSRFLIRIEPASVDEAAQARERARELFDSANLQPVGNARTAVLKEACDYRILAEMKRMIGTPKTE
jgi:hypothetical protein